MLRSVLLLALCVTCWRLAAADVYIMTSTYTFDPLPDVPADFGPDLDEGGISGYLRVADPEDSCSPYTYTDFKTPWVALIARQQQLKPTNCTFDVKVMHAQEAGAIAAIVYDDTYEALIIMSKPPSNPSPDIPSVFVSQKAGIIMKKLLALDDIRVNITPVTAIAWVSMLMSAFLGLLALTVVLATFYVMRSWSLWIGSQQARHGQARNGTGAGTGRPYDSGLSPRALRSLPVLIYEATKISSLPGTPVKSGPGPFQDDASDNEADEDASTCSRSSSASGIRLPGVHAGETKRVCAICLEQYEEGEKVRQLPCCHRFHMTCVDQWLSNRRFCPVCKHDASRPLAPAVQQQTSEPRAGAGGASSGGGNGGGAVPAVAAAASASPFLGFMRGFMGLLGNAWAPVPAVAAPSGRQDAALQEPLLGRQTQQRQQGQRQQQQAQGGLQQQDVMDIEAGVTLPLESAASGSSSHHHHHHHHHHRSLTGSGSGRTSHRQHRSARAAVAAAQAALASLQSQPIAIPMTSTSNTSSSTLGGPVGAQGDAAVAAATGAATSSAQPMPAAGPAGGSGAGDEIVLAAAEASSEDSVPPLASSRLEPGRAILSTRQARPTYSSTM